MEAKPNKLLYIAFTYTPYVTKELPFMDYSYSTYFVVDVALGGFLSFQSLTISS
jgi:hypothetical protein